MYLLIERRIFLYLLFFFLSFFPNAHNYIPQCTNAAMPNLRKYWSKQRRQQLKKIIILIWLQFFISLDQVKKLQL